ncbi:hypothetical protein BKA93DRAFT_882545 [Sparassis latifolia]
MQQVCRTFSNETLYETYYMFQNDVQTLFQGRTSTFAPSGTSYCYNNWNTKPRVHTSGAWQYSISHQKLRKSRDSTRRASIGNRDSVPAILSTFNPSAKDPQGGTEHFAKSRDFPVATSCAPANTVMVLSLSVRWVYVEIAANSQEISWYESFPIVVNERMNTVYSPLEDCFIAPLDPTPWWWSPQNASFVSGFTTAILRKGQKSSSST